MKIQRQSRSLLALFGSVADQSPGFSPDHIQSTIDVAWLLTSGRYVQNSSNNAAAGVGAGTGLTVPNGQFWLPISIEAAVLGKVAMTALAVSVGYGLESLSAQALAYREFSNALILVVAGHRMLTHYVPEHNVIAGTGSIFSCRVEALTGVANCDITLNVTYFLLPS